MFRTLALTASLFLAAIPALAHGAPPAKPRVSLQTGMGTIVIELETKRAPITANNFLAYVDQKKLDGTNFYRASRSTAKDGTGFIQGGIHHSYTRMLLPIKHEPTSLTGVKHVSGTISMARDAPGTAMGDFFITVGALPYMDAHKGDPGYAAFGHVVSGMDVVRKILAAHTDKGGSEALKDQMITKPIPLITAKRL